MHVHDLGRVAGNTRPKDLDHDFSKSFMVCRDADEKAKDRPAKRSGGNVAKVYMVLLQELAFLRTGGKREPQEDDARGPAKRRRAEAAACSVKLNHACPGPCPMIRHAAEVIGRNPEKLPALPLQASLSIFVGACFLCRSNTYVQDAAESPSPPQQA